MDRVSYLSSLRGHKVPRCKSESIAPRYNVVSCATDCASSSGNFIISVSQSASPSILTSRNAVTSARFLESKFALTTSVNSLPLCTCSSLSSTYCSLLNCVGIET